MTRKASVDDSFNNCGRREAVLAAASSPSPSWSVSCFVDLWSVSAGSAGMYQGTPRSPRSSQGRYSSQGVAEWERVFVAVTLVRHAI